MSLTIKLSRTGYDVDTDALRYADATGAYDAATNPGGYGGPNAKRPAGALFLVGERVRADAAPGERFGPPLTDGDDPLTRSEFVLCPGADGFIRVRLLRVPVASAAQLTALEAELLTEGTLYYDTDNRRLRVFAAGAFVPTTVAALPEALAGRYEVLRVEEALTPRSQQLRARLLERVAGLYYDGAAENYQNPGDEHLLRLHGAAKALLASADICWQRGQPYLFQLRIERLAVLSAESDRLLA